MSGPRRRMKVNRTRYDVKRNRPVYSWDELEKVYIFAKEVEGLAAGTIRNKREYYGTFVEFIKANYSELTPDELTVTIAREFIHYLRYDHVKHAANEQIAEEFKTKGLSVATVNSYIKSLRAMFNFLIDEDYLLENPFKRVKLLPAERDTVTALDIEQVAKLLKEPNKRTYSGFRDYVLMTLLVDTGLRIGEALSLRHEDIDFKTNIIEIRGEVAKNRTTRYVPFSAKTSKLLRELWMEVEEFHTPYLFCTVYGNQLDPVRVRSVMREYGKGAGLEGVKLSPHVLRHTFAKYYLLNGGDMFTLQKILGHSSLDMVRVYVQMTHQDNRTQHAKFSPLNNL